MSKPKCRMGIIGCGSIAQAAALFFRLDPKVELVYCCDNDRDRAEKFSRRFGIPKFTSENYQIFESKDVDAIYLAVPHYLHRSMVIDSIEAKKPILCEKPITTNMKDAEEIVAFSERTGVKVGVNYQYRYDLAVNQLKQAVEQGILGQIYYTRIHIPWYRSKDYLVGWHQNKFQAGGGTLLTQGSHAIDFVQWIIGSRAKNALGNIGHVRYDVEVEDLAMGILELENGGRIEVCSSMVTHPERGIDVQLVSEFGTTRYNNFPFPSASFSGGRLPMPRLAVPGFFALQRSLCAFVRWVQGEGEYLIPASQSLTALESVLAIYRSAESGQKERI